MNASHPTTSPIMACDLSKSSNAGRSILSLGGHDAARRAREKEQKRRRGLRHNRDTSRGWEKAEKKCRLQTLVKAGGESA